MTMTYNDKGLLLSHKKCYPGSPSFEVYYVYTFEEGKMQAE